MNNYSELKQQVEDWAYNTNPAFIAQIPNLIKMAQRDLAREMRIPAIEDERKGKPFQGSMTIPDNLVELISLRDCCGTLFEQTSFKRLREARRDNLHVDVPIFCRHRDRWEFHPIVPDGSIEKDKDGEPVLDGDDDNTVTVLYYTTVDDMVSDTDCNTWLFLMPNALLYATLAHAGVFNQDMEMANKYTQMAAIEMQQYQKQVDESEFSSSPIVATGFNPY